MWRRRHHQDSQQACNASTHHTIQDTSLQWRSTLGLVTHLIGPTPGGLIYQSQIAAKCTNNVTDTTNWIKLHELRRKCGDTRGMRRRRRGNENLAPKAPGNSDFDPLEL
eukprot:gene9517-biopygen22733